MTEQLGDHATDIVAVAALASLAWAAAPEASVQILAGAISSVAVGKRYLASGGKS